MNILIHNLVKLKLCDIKNSKIKLVGKKWKHSQETIVYYKVLLMSLTCKKVERSEKVVLKGVFKHYIFKFAEPVFYKKQCRFP